MNDTFLLLLIALVGIGLGYTLGIMFYKPRQEDSQVESERSSSKSDLVEVARLWRVPGERDVFPEVEGQVYKKADDMSDEQWKRLYQSTEDLRRWMKGHLHMADENAAASAAPVPASSKEVVNSMSNSNSINSTSMPANQPSPPSLNPVSILARAVTADVNADTPAPSIAAQVDEILQEKLEDSPLKSRGVRLMELPDQGMVVMIGMDQYDGVDAVPDPDVQALIREAVAEWEGRMTENEK